MQAPDENVKKLQEQATGQQKKLEEQAQPVIEKLEKTDTSDPVPMPDPPEASQELSPKGNTDLTYDIDGNPNAY
jgi:hypothetical protein